MEITIDLHGMFVDEAEYTIIHEIETALPNVWRINVIHGYKKGTAIRDMVRKKLKHPKIKRIYVDMNPGVTIIELKHD